MDPITVGTGAYGAVRVFSTLARGGQDAGKTTGFARRAFRLAGTYSLNWLDEDFAPSTDGKGFNADQIADIGRFLTSTGVQPLLSLLAIATLTEPCDSDLVQRITDGLTNEARKWNSSSRDTWLENADAIWRRLVEIHRETLPTVGLGQEWVDDIAYFEEFVNTPLSRVDGGPSTYSVRYIRELIRLASDIERLQRACDTATDVARHIAATALDPIITHTEVGGSQTPNFDELYINRSFIDPQDGELLNSSNLTAGTAPFRLIVTGAPGAGKTTFLQHFRREYCTKQGRPVFVVRCREYAATNWDRTKLFDFLIDRYNSEYGDSLNETAAQDIFTLGRAVLVLDGLDEVIDPLRRIDLVKRINSIGSMFPFLSMLVTSREVGYDRAPVDRRMFTRVALTEFELDQAEAYVERWFTVVGNPELTDRFMHDSESVPDLRLNPLMLSLLCILYRESGAIPSRRLDIYSECARLLFHRWDSHRQIKIDGAIPDFADTLMQEIARWYYTSPSTQAGLEESVIKGMLKRILIDQTGFSEDRAQEASADFLEFCAGRAWLLNATGSNHRGERVFSFTHKTFSEYFAAESFARHADSVAEICERITAVAKNDSSSVLPELLIQSYGRHSAQGALRVINELQKSASTLLLLRLIEGAPLPASSRRQVFERIARAWENGLPQRAELLAILQLNAIARDQFLNEYLLSKPELCNTFLSGWADTVLCGSSSRYETSWGGIINQLIRQTNLDDLEKSDGAVWNWRMLRGDAVYEPAIPFLPLVCKSAFGTAPGIAWYNVEQRFRVQKSVHNQEVCSRHTKELVDWFNKGGKLTLELIGALQSMVSRGGAQAAWTLRWGKECFKRPELDLYAYVTLALHEAPFGSNDATRLLYAGVLSGPVKVHDRAKRGVEPYAQNVEESKRILRMLPTRLTNWTRGRDSLTVRASDA